jgi:hypothetical protein
MSRTNAPSRETSRSAGAPHIEFTALSITFRPKRGEDNNDLLHFQVEFANAKWKSFFSSSTLDLPLTVD